MDMLDQLNVENKLTKQELQSVIGGARFSGTVINAFTATFKALYSMGQNLGTGIRRIRKKNLCSL